MHLGANRLTHSGVDHAVPLQRGLAGEDVGDNLHSVMTAPAGARMAGMSFALILDLQAFRCKRLGEAVTQMLHSLLCLTQGRTFLKGRTVTRA